jgi:glycosyltransferase involved in cell wall biosynthesis
VIPCCADFERLRPSGLDARGELGLDGRPILVYVGKLTGVYMDREMAQFFEAARRHDPSLAFVVLTQGESDGLVEELQRGNVGEDDYRITSATPDAVGAYLAMASAAICFCHPKHSLIASSPTKIGEYLAAGLPVASGPDVGDTDVILEEYRAGVIVTRFEDPAYEQAAAQLLALAADPASRERCREVARTMYSLEEVGIPRYDALYRDIAELAHG